MPKLNLKIENMMCEMCVAKVKEALEKAGAENVSVKVGKASMTYDESKVSEAALVEAVVSAGYPAKVKKGLF